MYYVHVDMLGSAIPMCFQMLPVA